MQFKGLHEYKNKKWYIPWKMGEKKEGRKIRKYDEFGHEFCASVMQVKK